MNITQSTVTPSYEKPTVTSLSEAELSASIEAWGFSGIDS